MHTRSGLNSAGRCPRSASISTAWQPLFGSGGSSISSGFPHWSLGTRNPRTPPVTPIASMRLQALLPMLKGTRLWPPPLYLDATMIDHARQRLAKASVFSFVLPLPPAYLAKRSKSQTRTTTENVCSHVCMHERTAKDKHIDCATRAKIPGTAQDVRTSDVSGAGLIRSAERYAVCYS